MSYIETATSLAGRVIIVTGASRGLGKEFAESLAQAHASLVLCDLDEAQVGAVATELNGPKHPVISFRCDVTDESAVESLVRKAVDRFGRLDGLVNNAGITSQEKSEETSLDRWKKVIDVNLVGTFCMSRAAARVMLNQRRGAIVNLASINGLGAPAFHNASAYCASKAGVVGLTKALAKEWGASGIRVNAIAPGYIETEMTRARLQDEAYNAGIIGRTPLARIGSPVDLTGAMRFLLSDEAAYVTGQVLAVDGGWTAL
jgi:NAD(P)-dependent dehydrogenase (short-subunit alcohol dehydrogenase family)